MTTPDYERAVADIAVFANKGRFSTAARAAEALWHQYPQEYRLVLWSASLRFRAGHYGWAVRHYRHAVKLSNGSLESRLGLATAMLYDGRVATATRELEHLHREFPEAKGVTQMLDTARAHPILVATPWFVGIGHVYGHHPILRHGFGLQTGVGLNIATHGLVAVSYGFTWIRTIPPPTTADQTAASRELGPQSAIFRQAVPGGQGNGTGNDMGNAGGSARTSTRQHQIHGSVGATWPLAGFALQYGYLRQAAGNDVHAAGASVRASPWGDIVLDAGATVTGGAARPRYALGWRLPVHKHLSLRPAVAMQTEGRTVLPAGFLTLALQGPPGQLWLGGKYGRERQPAYLNVPVIFNLDGDIEWGAWTGGLAHLPGNVDLFVGYEVHDLRVFTTTSSANTQAHYISLGISFANRTRTNP